MLRMLTLLGTVGAAWALSQYLPSKDSHGQTDTAAAIATRAITVPAGQPVGQRSVALLDLAVSALPADSSAQVAADFAPAPAAAATALRTTAPAELSNAESSEPQTSEVAPSEIPPEAGTVENPKLTRQIQRELRRVGCLKAAADGVWGSGTERAMRRFAERIDADLPVDDPDSVLLILLEKFEDRACGTPCPAGEIPNARGRCEAVEQTAEAVAPAEPAQIAALASEDSPPLAEPEAGEPADVAQSKPSAETATQPSKARPRRAKARIVRTTVARVAKAKRVRIARAAPPRRKTRWALPRYYGLGVNYAKPSRVASAPKKRKRRIGAAAAYRRWLTRSDITMR